jgi:hypothetical protein
MLKSSTHRSQDLEFRCESAGAFGQPISVSTATGGPATKSFGRALRLHLFRGKLRFAFSANTKGGVRTAVLALVGVGLAGCNNPQVAIPAEATPQAQHFMEMASSAAKVQEYMSDYTRMTYDPKRGTQVEYNAGDSRSYLWYPGSAFVTQGNWKVTEGIAPDQVHAFNRACYLYSRLSYDPTTNTPGGNWECIPGWFEMIRTKERVPGDPFGLAASARAPFTLSPAPTTLAELKRQQTHR